MKLTKTRIVVAATLAIVAMVTSAQADIVISEYFYNLNGSESGKTEWIEITNTGASTVDLSGWVYGDSQDNHYSDPFASGTSLAAGSSAVIVFQPASTFHGIWGPGIQVINYTIGGGLDGVSLSKMVSTTLSTTSIMRLARTGGQQGTVPASTCCPTPTLPVPTTSVRTGPLRRLVSMAPMQPSP